MGIYASTQTNEKQAVGIQSGFPTLDNILHGWKEGELTLIAARSAVGKTSFMLQLATNAAVDNNIPTAYFSLEAPGIQLGEKLLKPFLRKNSEPQLNISGNQALEEKLQYLKRAPMYFDDTPCIKPKDLYGKLKYLVNKKQVRCVFVDYILLMYADKKECDRTVEIKSILSSLKGFAKEFNISILCSLMLPKNCGRELPAMEVLQNYYGYIFQFFDTILCMDRDTFKNECETKIIIVKDSQAQGAELELFFDKNNLRFIDTTATYQELIGHIQSLKTLLESVDCNALWHNISTISQLIAVLPKKYNYDTERLSDGGEL